MLVAVLLDASSIGQYGDTREKCTRNLGNLKHILVALLKPLLTTVKLLFHFLRTTRAPSVKQKMEIMTPFVRGNHV